MPRKGGSQQANKNAGRNSKGKEMEAYTFTSPARDVLAHHLRQIGAINLNLELPREVLTPMSPEDQRQSMVATAQSVAHATTKFQVAWKGIADDIAAGNTSSAAEDGKYFAENMERDIKNLVVAANIIISLNQDKWGQYVVQGIRDAVGGVIAAVEALLTYMYEWKRGDADNHSALITGKVWDKCTVVEKVPLDNNSAACSTIRTWMLAIKDAMTELNDLAEKETKKEDDHAHDEDEGEDEDEWDDDDEALTEQEAKVIPGCQLLVKSLYGLLNGSLPLLDLDERRKDKQREIEKKQKEQGESGETNTEEEEEEIIKEDEAQWLDDIVGKARALSEFVDELIISLYSPQDPAAIRSHAAKLDQVGHEILNLLESNPVVERRERYGRLRNLLHTMMGKASTDIETSLPPAS